MSISSDEFEDCTHNFAMRTNGIIAYDQKLAKALSLSISETTLRIPHKTQPCYILPVKEALEEISKITESVFFQDN